jgi:hypothetical protein
MPPKNIKSPPQKVILEKLGEISLQPLPPYQLNEGDEDALKNTQLLVHAKDGDEFANLMHDMGLTLERDSSVTNKISIVETYFQPMQCSKSSPPGTSLKL